MATREKPFSGVSATGREKLEIIWVRALIKHIEPEDRGLFELGGAIGDLNG